MLTVLLVLATITTLAAAMTERSYLSLRRTINLNNMDQAYWYSLSSEALAKRVLKQDFEDADGTVHLQQYWATADVVYPVDNGTIAGRIEDLRACFNLNGLSQELTDTEKQQDPYQKPLAQRQFIAMLEALEVDRYTAEMLADRIKDFVDEDNDPSGSYGAESPEYEARQYPYRAPNQLMAHHSELRAVLGTSPELYQFLQDYICVIPGESRQILNVNTVTEERAALLVGMLEGRLSLGDAQSLINNRPGDGWEDSEKFWEESSVSRLTDLSAQTKGTLAVDSEYFRLNGAAQVDNAVFRLESVLRRGGGNNLTVLTRQYGGQQ
ncbi:general secretion pathway protein K [Ferrimonas marina]|uniref:Type II secretion system protein K n=1 Tax=Ferrimonas marina TaxID=299255 RepID=A0A1M5Z8P0_9GAMM|nr:general secretion pathway protein K [Ferrimonas marina]